jgi:hypothetical protein
MNAKELFFADHKPAGVFSCGKCGVIARDPITADECCKPHICPYCHKEVEDKHRTAHESCIYKARIEKAEKLESWEGWVYLEGYGYKEGYFESMEDLLEYLDEEEKETDPRPEWAFVCKTIPFKGPALNSIIESCCEEMYEDAEESLSGLGELEAAIREFSEANKRMVSYCPDYKRVARIPGK